VLRILHVSASVSALGGGISIALQALARAQAEKGLDVSVIGQDDGGTAMEGWPEGMLHHLAARRLPGMRWSGAMRQTLAALRPQLVHAHGLWEQPSISVPRHAKRHRLPYLISPHGMLDRWALANSQNKKRLAGALYERANLRGAACLHALCKSEAEAIRAYGLRNPIVVIPNGVDLPASDSPPPTATACEAGRPRTLLFLGRLHPKKGLVNALKAWSLLRNTGTHPAGGWRFAIAGWDQSGHEAELKALCDELGVPHRDVPAADFLTNSDGNKGEVVFLGPVFKEVKEALLWRSHAFILPSFSEGLPMSVLEAWAYGLPVLMTDHCNLPEGFAAEAAIRIGTDAEDIAEGMGRIFSSSGADLAALSTNGRRLVAERFTWNRVATQMAQVYHWILGNADKPSCVLG